MMKQYTKYTAMIAHTDLAVVNKALAAVSGKFEGMFSIPIIEVGDRDSIDANGVYTGTPRYWATSVKLRDSELSVLTKALSGIATLKSQKVNSRDPARKKDTVDTFAAKHNHRRPGKSLARSLGG